MTIEKTDILISGGGVAGLIAAAAFGAKGFDVICVDPTPPVTNAADKNADLRTTAFLQPSRQMLIDTGIWPYFEPNAAPLQVMRIIDAGGKEPQERLRKDFNATDISDLPFGWNLPNWFLREKLLERIETLENVEFLPGIGTKTVLTRSDEARVTLSDGTRISSKLLIAADGRNSPVREAVGIGSKTIRYGQKALAFSVTHPRPHDNVSTEIHRSGGPFTLVPLPDQNGAHASAIVWMERGPEAKRLQSLPEDAFTHAMNERSCGILGELTLASRRSIWPIISQYADRMSAERVALLAEAAHVVPPIGAQGLNMSLGDLRALLKLAENAPSELGSQKMLTAYHRMRHLEVRARVAGIDKLNRASMADGQIWRDLRAGALDAFYSLAPVRKTLMKAGLGTR
ncbi:MAG: UbiH/UbiF family hydroxylase [Halocynthiibacter sp.]